MLRWLPILAGAALLGYGLTVGKDAKAAAAGDLSNAVMVVALPAGAVKVMTIKDVTIYQAAGRYYAQKGDAPLVLPLTGTNLLNFAAQIKTLG